MKKSINYLLGVILLSGVALQHCTTSEEDDAECLDGYYYDDRLKSCKQESKEIVSADLPDSGVQDGSVSEYAAVMDTGIGIPCTEHSQCTGAAYYCVVNPFTGQGYCTYENCDESSCPEGYNCCECMFGPLVCGKLNDPDIQGGCNCVP